MGLDESAVEAVKKWRFRPGMEDGKPVNVHANVQIHFQADSASTSLASFEEPGDALPNPGYDEGPTLRPEVSVRPAFAGAIGNAYQD